MSRALPKSLAKEKFRMHNESTQADLDSLIAACEQEPENIDHSTRLAQHYADIGWLNQAIDTYKKIVATTPDNYAVLLDYGNVNFKHGDIALALSTFKKLTILKPDRVEGWNNLGILYLGESNLSEAGTAFGQILRNEPDNVGALINMGNVHQLKGELPLAIDSFKKALHVRPDYSDGWYDLGNALYADNNLDEAINAYQKALRYNPSLGSAHKNLGVILERKKNYPEALKEYEQALLLNRADAGLFVNIGNVAMEMKDFERARESYLKAVRLTPRDLSGWMGLRACALTKGDIEAYLKATRAILMRLNPEIIAESIRVVRLLEKLPEALELVRMADRFDKASEALDAERMLTYAFCGVEPGKVTALQKKMVSISTPSDTILVAIAELYCFQKEFLRANAALQRLVVRTVSAHKLFWKTRIGLCLWSELLHETEAFLKNDPESFDAHFYQAIGLVWTGEPHQAKMQLSKAIEKGFADFELITPETGLLHIYQEIVLAASSTKVTVSDDF